MAHFYLAEFVDVPEIGSAIAVHGAEARHAATVSRLAVGEPILIGNGVGIVATGVVLSADATEVLVRVVEVAVHSTPTPSLWLAQALAKSDRDEFAVQAATELGVDGVIPWAAQRSIVRWEGAKLAKGRERWEAIVREASKQSLRPFIPDVAQLSSTKQLAALTERSLVLVLEPTAERSLTELSLTPAGSDVHWTDIVIVVGPEGGIAPVERELLTAAGAIRVRLGSTILRTSTAGPAALAVLSAKLGRW